MSALWWELGVRFNLCSKDISPAEIAEQVYRCWQTQNVLFVFHNVDCMPQAYLQELIQNFWQLLTKKAKNYGTSNFQLLMFLVDYEGKVGNLDALFSDKINPTKPAPVKPPKINQFTEDLLWNWMVKEFHELPIKLTDGLRGTAIDTALCTVMKYTFLKVPLIKGDLGGSTMYRIAEQTAVL
ncbi:MAG: hypothetical protein F6K47_34635 [Symploca sp. SIO2E6]|nr:hypothetical protein [Symploca sp. SIO2E6]